MLKIISILFKKRLTFFFLYDSITKIGNLWIYRLSELLKDSGPKTEWQSCSDELVKYAELAINIIKLLTGISLLITLVIAIVLKCFCPKSV